MINMFVGLVVSIAIILGTLLITELVFRAREKR